jgi:hypothetical protein
VDRRPPCDGRSPELLVHLPPPAKIELVILTIGGAVLRVPLTSQQEGFYRLPPRQPMTSQQIIRGRGGQASAYAIRVAL